MVAGPRGEDDLSMLSNTVYALMGMVFLTYGAAGALRAWRGTLKCRILMRSFGFFDLQKIDKKRKAALKRQEEQKKEALRREKEERKAGRSRGKKNGRPEIDGGNENIEEAQALFSPNKVEDALAGAEQMDEGHASAGDEIDDDHASTAGEQIRRAHDTSAEISRLHGRQRHGDGKGSGLFPTIFENEEYTNDSHLLSAGSRGTTDQYEDYYLGLRGSAASGSGSHHDHVLPASRKAHFAADHDGDASDRDEVENGGGESSCACSCCRKRKANDTNQDGRGDKIKEPHDDSQMLEGEDELLIKDDAEMRQYLEPLFDVKEFRRQKAECLRRILSYGEVHLSELMSETDETPSHIFRGTWLVACILLAQVRFQDMNYFSREVLDLNAHRGYAAQAQNQGRVQRQGQGPQGAGTNSRGPAMSTTAVANFPQAYQLQLNGDSDGAHAEQGHAASFMEHQMAQQDDYGHGANDPSSPNTWSNPNTWPASTSSSASHSSSSATFEDGEEEDGGDWGPAVLDHSKNDDVVRRSWSSSNMDSLDPRTSGLLTMTLDANGDSEFVTSAPSTLLQQDEIVRRNRASRSMSSSSTSATRASSSSFSQTTVVPKQKAQAPVAGVPSQQGQVASSSNTNTQQGQQAQQDPTRKVVAQNAWQRRAVQRSTIWPTETTIGLYHPTIIVLRYILDVFRGIFFVAGLLFAVYIPRARRKDYWVYDLPRDVTSREMDSLMRNRNIGWVVLDQWHGWAAGVATTVGGVSFIGVVFDIAQRVALGRHPYEVLLYRKTVLLGPQILEEDNSFDSYSPQRDCAKDNLYKTRWTSFRGFYHCAEIIPGEAMWSFFLGIRFLLTLLYFWAVATTAMKFFRVRIGETSYYRGLRSELCFIKIATYEFGFLSIAVLYKPQNLNDYFIWNEVPWLQVGLYVVTLLVAALLLRSTCYIVVDLFLDFEYSDKILADKFDDSWLPQEESMKAHIMDVRSTRDYDCPREHLQGLLHLPPDELEIEDVLLYRQRDRTTNFQVAPRREQGRGSAGRGGIGSGGGGDTSNCGTAGDSSTSGTRAADSSSAATSFSYNGRGARGDAVSVFRGSLIMQKEWRDSHSQMSSVTGEVDVDGGELELRRAASSGSGHRGGLQDQVNSSTGEHQDDEDHGAQDALQVLGEDPSLLGVIHERSGEEDSTPGSFHAAAPGGGGRHHVIFLERGGGASGGGSGRDLLSGRGEQAGTLYEDDYNSTRSGRTTHLPPQARGPLALTAMLTRPRAPVHEIRWQCSNRSGGSENQTSFGSEMLVQMDDENAGSRSGNRGRNAGATSSSSISGARRGGGGRDRNLDINRDSVREDYNADHHVDDHDQRDVDDGDSTTSSGSQSSRESSARRRLLLALPPAGASQDENSGPWSSFGTAGTTRTIGPADRHALHRNCPWLDPQLLRAMTDQTRQR